MNRLLRPVSIAAIALCFLLPEAAHAYGAAAPTPSAATPPAPVELILAYVDPGAAGFVIVTVLGFFAAIGYTARAYLSRLKQMFFRSKSSAQEAETPDPSDV